MQFTFGSNNRQTSIDKIVVEVKDTISRIEDVFVEYDKKIEELFGKIIDSKIKEGENNKVLFKSQKVFSSLMKIGIPIENAYQIVIHVLNNIVIHEKNGLYNDKKLSTHEIRKIVAYGILHCNLEGVPLKTIEDWGDKYVRRYGHDSKRIKIYYMNSAQEDDLSYPFVRDKLLYDIAIELGIEKYTYSKKIRKSQLKYMSEDVIDFINNCNLYRIRYDILKGFVREMVLQPPHPWLVDAETAEEIRKYDIKAVEKHYLKIKEKLNTNDYSGEYYIICEILHHTCSSILAGYKEILGCKDLDAFVNLESIVRQMCNNEQDLVLDYNIAELPSDLEYIGVNFREFHLLLERIHENIENRNRQFKITKIFLEDILKLHDIAVALYENVNKQQMEKFLDSSWDTYTDNEKINYIKLFFAVIDYKRIGDKLFGDNKNRFWFDADLKGRTKFLVVCPKEMDFMKLNEFVKQPKIQKILENILIIAEDEKQSEALKKDIDKIDTQNIVTEFLYKNELKKIFYSIDKINQLDLILQKKLIY